MISCGFSQNKPNDEINTYSTLEDLFDKTKKKIKQDCYVGLKLFFNVVEI